MAGTGLDLSGHREGDGGYDALYNKLRQLDPNYPLKRVLILGYC